MESVSYGGKLDTGRRVLVLPHVNDVTDFVVSPWGASPSLRIGCSGCKVRRVVGREGEGTAIGM